MKDIREMRKIIEWQKGFESLRFISTGFFFGGILVFMQKENLMTQIILLSIGAVLFLFSIIACEVFRYRINKNENHINVKKLNKNI